MDFTYQIQNKYHVANTLFEYNASNLFELPILQEKAISSIWERRADLKELIMNLIMIYQFTVAKCALEINIGLSLEYSLQPKNPSMDPPIHFY